MLENVCILGFAAMHRMPGPKESASVYAAPIVSSEGLEICAATAGLQMQPFCTAEDEDEGEGLCGGGKWSEVCATVVGGRM